MSRQQRTKKGQVIARAEVARGFQCKSQIPSREQRMEEAENCLSFKGLAKKNLEENLLLDRAQSPEGSHVGIHKFLPATTLMSLESKLTATEKELDQVTAQMDRAFLSREEHGLPDNFLSVAPKEINNVPFKGQSIRARLLSVVDGDTICVAIFCGQILKIKVRLDGIDTPELHPKGVDTVGEALAGERVKKYVTSLLEAYQLVSIRLLKLDKYGGRYVGHVYLESGESISEHLLARGYAKKYDGRAKPPWKIEDFRAISGK